MRAGRWTCSISQAMVAVLPLPVIPSEGLVAKSVSYTLGEGGNGRRLVAGGRKRAPTEEQVAGWRSIG